jgi:hypothetical protein
VDHVLPDVPIRQLVLTLPFPLRFPLAFDGKLLGQVLRIFTDTVSSWYRKRHLARGLPDGQTGAVTAIQRANSDLRLSPHFHTLALDGVYGPDRDGRGHMFHPAPAPSQEEIERLVEKVSKRILRFLQRRGVITLVTAPGDGEVAVVTDESMGAKDPFGLMAAYAEGFNILRHANVGREKREADAETAPLRHPEFYQYDLDIGEIAELWRRGSVVNSWLLDLMAHALAQDPELSRLSGIVSDSGEGRWTVEAAIDVGAGAPVLGIALSERFASRGEHRYADKLISAMRSEFGGHAEKKE